MLHSEYARQNQPLQRSPELSTQIAEDRESEFDIFSELEYLQNLVLNGTHVPFTDLVVIDRQSVLKRIERIKRNLPFQLATAIEINDRQEEIIRQTEIYVERLVSSAEEKADAIVNESTLVRQAELTAAKIKLQTERECEHLRQIAVAESQEILAGADSYADGVLGNIEHQLNHMLGVIRNGRQQLNEGQSTEREEF